MSESENSYDTDNEPDTEVEVLDTEDYARDGALQADNEDSEDDQFKKAESSTQKRIDRLTKKMREAERREQEAINYARNVQTEAEHIKKRMESLDNSYVSEFTTRVGAQMDQAENDLSRAMELGDTKSAIEAQRRVTALAIQADRAEQAKSQQAQQQAQKQAQQEVNGHATYACPSGHFWASDPLGEEPDPANRGCTRPVRALRTNIPLWTLCALKTLWALRTRSSL